MLTHLVRRNLLLHHTVKVQLESTAQAGTQSRHKYTGKGSPEIVRKVITSNGFAMPGSFADLVKKDIDPSQNTLQSGSFRKSDQTPRTGRDEEACYILTLLTDAVIHGAMTSLRSKYFPKSWYKLDAHLSLFHALPGSKLESDIIPALEDVVSNSKPFEITATKPEIMSRGIKVILEEDNTAHRRYCAHVIHARLLSQWHPFLSNQDRKDSNHGQVKLHYTIMNKVSNRVAIKHALREIEQDWKPIPGTAMGLSLFLFDHNEWRHTRDFLFQQPMR